MLIKKLDGSDMISFLSIICLLCGIHVFSLHQRSSSFACSRTCLASKNLIHDHYIKEALSPHSYFDRRRKSPVGDVSSSSISTTNGIDSSQKRIIPQGQPRSRELNNPNKLRIIGGTARGRKIDSPNVYLRPMMSKVREAIFSTLTYLHVFAPEKEARVLDIFAGAGSVGLESLSRGAKHATFVDLSRDCVNTILGNAEKCGFGKTNDRHSFPGRISLTAHKEEPTVHVVTASAEEFLLNPYQYGVAQDSTYHFVSLTPPYREVSYPQLISLLCNSTLLAPDSILLLEYPMEMGTLPHLLGDEGKFIGLRNRRYGRTVLAMYVYKPTRHFDFRSEEFSADSIRKRRG